MKFKFDPKKSDSNQNKHGIDFIEAQGLWDDIDLLEIPAKTTDEMRPLVIGKINEKHWTDMVTYSNDNIRIISVPSSRNEEIELYES
ncbi:MAG: BrnT family toxin [Proteobacteria bacterium]|nr:BrnT family toxin [Pseudomonadota bacterium]MBU4471154.1 BrnT family toxin [Pseudomonadota bacterium]MCG2750988.1 BrnT family toxin [Desulfobacteraceae bacterium]